MKKPRSYKEEMTDAYKNKNSPITMNRGEVLIGRYNKRSILP